MLLVKATLMAIASYHIGVLIGRLICLVCAGTECYDCVCGLQWQRALCSILPVETMKRTMVCTVFSNHVDNYGFCVFFASQDIVTLIEKKLL